MRQTASTLSVFSSSTWKAKKVAAKSTRMSIEIINHGQKALHPHGHGHHLSHRRKASPIAGPPGQTTWCAQKCVDEGMTKTKDMMMPVMRYLCLLHHFIYSLLSPSCPSPSDILQPKRQKKGRDRERLVHHATRPSFPSHVVEAGDATMGQIQPRLMVDLFLDGVMGSHADVCRLLGISHMT